MKQYIYMIYCKDESISEFYIGRTNNFHKRFQSHRSCSKVNSPPLYKFMNTYGGWDNWDMVILEEYDCGQYEIDMIEKRWIKQLKPTLNTLLRKW